MQRHPLETNVPQPQSYFSPQTQEGEEDLQGTTRDRTTSPDGMFSRKSDTVLCSPGPTSTYLPPPSSEEERCNGQQQKEHLNTVNFNSAIFLFKDPMNNRKSICTTISYCTNKLIPGAVSVTIFSKWLQRFPDFGI